MRGRFAGGGDVKLRAEQKLTLEEWKERVCDVGTATDAGRYPFDLAMRGWVRCFFASGRRKGFLKILSDNVNELRTPAAPFTSNEKAALLPETLCIAGFIYYDGYEPCLGIRDSFPKGVRECGGEPLYRKGFPERAAELKKAVKRWTKRELKIEIKKVVDLRNRTVILGNDTVRLEDDASGFIYLLSGWPPGENGGKMPFDYELQQVGNGKRAADDRRRLSDDFAASGLPRNLVHNVVGTSRGKHQGYYILPDVKVKGGSSRSEVSRVQMDPEKAEGLNQDRESGKRRPRRNDTFDDDDQP
jgi:hypothetical protein